MTLEIVDLAKNPFWASLQTAQKYNTLLLEFAAINIGTDLQIRREIIEREIGAGIRRCCDQLFA